MHGVDVFTVRDGVIQTVVTIFGEDEQPQRRRYPRHVFERRLPSVLGNGPSVRRRGWPDGGHDRCQG